MTWLKSIRPIPALISLVIMEAFACFSSLACYNVMAGLGVLPRALNVYAVMSFGTGTIVIFMLFMIIIHRALPAQLRQ